MSSLTPDDGTVDTLRDNDMIQKSVVPNSPLVPRLEAFALPCITEQAK